MIEGRPFAAGGNLYQFNHPLHVTQNTFVGCHELDLFVFDEESGMYRLAGFDIAPRGTHMNMQAQLANSSALARALRAFVNSVP